MPIPATEVVIAMTIGDRDTTVKVEKQHCPQCLGNRTRFSGAKRNPPWSNLPFTALFRSCGNLV